MYSANAGLLTMGILIIIIQLYRLFRSKYGMGCARERAPLLHMPGSYGIFNL